MTAELHVAMSRLTVPDLALGVDTLTAAMAYAAGGFYVAPVAAGTKDPGSVLRQGWQHQTSRDDKVLASWLAGTDHGIALHAGRSDAVVFDVDHPDRLPDVLGDAFGTLAPPMQASRAGNLLRGHYVFGQPPGRRIGNGVGRLGHGWGDVRGLNGVIVVAPSIHADAANGGLYAWQQTGVVPLLPDVIADLLDDASPSMDVASDAAVVEFLAAHTTASRPEFVGVWVHTFAKAVRAGGSRHTCMVSTLVGAMKEAAAGYVCAAEAVERLRTVFLAAVASPGAGTGQGAARTGGVARSEWEGLLCWAVGQATAADLDEVHERVAHHAPPIGFEDLLGSVTAAVGSAPVPNGTPVGGTASATLAEDPPDDVAAGATWAPVDLSGVVAGLLSGTLTRHEPTVGALVGGGAILYSAKVNGIAGASGSGKSFTAQTAAAQEMSKGGHVVYVDLEDDEAGVVGRLLDMGVDSHTLLSHFHYVHPDEAYSTAAAAVLTTLVAEFAPTLVVVDSTGESMALDGAKPNDDDDTARWFRTFPTAIARLGPAVLVLDHVVKSDEGGLWPIGSQRKRAAISGAQYMQSVVKAFSKDTDGGAKLVCAKDRHGTYRLGQKVAELSITPDGFGGVSLTLSAATDAKREPASFRPTSLMEKVSTALAATGEPLSQRAILKKVSGNEENKRKAIDVLVAEGYVNRVEGTRNSQQHTLVRAYRQTDDPMSDRYERGDGRVHPASVTVSPSNNGTGETDTHRIRETVGRQSETVTQRAAS